MDWRDVEAVRLDHSEACDMTAPSRVMRSASHLGTCPTCSGRSALPALRAITSQSFRVAYRQACRSCFVLYWVSRGNALNENEDLTAAVGLLRTADSILTHEGRLSRETQSRAAPRRRLDHHYRYY